jgi:hypothetical protein
MNSSSLKCSALIGELKAASKLMSTASKSTAKLSAPRQIHGASFTSPQRDVLAGDARCPTPSIGHKQTTSMSGCVIG